MVSLHIEPAAWVVLAAAVAGYRVGVVRLAGRSIAWPWWRSAAFAAAVVTVFVATTSPLPADAASDPAQGAIAQVLLLMLAPLLLAWAAPHTLALEAGGRVTARRLRAVIESRALRALTYPVAAWLLYAGVLAVIYGTSFYTDAARHEIIGQPLQVLLLALGCLFLWPVFGADPLPRRLHPVPAMGYLLALLPYFTLLGFAIESQGAAKVVAAHGAIQAAANLGSDLEGAGGVLWTVGGLGAICLTIMVLVGWLRTEERATPNRETGLDPAAVAQLTAWREQRAAAAEEEASRRAALAEALASRRSKPAST
ncbi:cytochrome c oxidase assembly protein [Acidiferrimicrobium sp. IK]|uniref:cytochrome c oxidase assembly protein n=1 Tax=Acidiferrimicrobium sp. IK TaxID=2871700 RepID=UPI0021CB8F4B|nr:cytochrome c oxidase assembly protein [Acidiferrimicrobium sp. IK]MCU4186312.1 cytochrome c oxidase assembly protein [Acidiferrimicrobium sp. IK]